MAKTYFLGVNRGEYQGRPFTSVYLGDEITRDGGKGLIAYRKSYRGDSPAGLYCLNPFLIDSNISSLPSLIFFLILVLIPCPFK